MWGGAGGASAVASLHPQHIPRSAWEQLFRVWEIDVQAAGWQERPQWTSFPKLVVVQPGPTLPARLICPWHPPGKNAGVGCIVFSRGSARLRNQTPVSCTGGRFFSIWVAGAALKATFKSLLDVFCASETDTVHDSLEGTPVVHIWGRGPESTAKCVTLQGKRSRMQCLCLPEQKLMNGRLVPACKFWLQNTKLKEAAILSLSFSVLGWSKPMQEAGFRGEFDPNAITKIISCFSLKWYNHQN